MSSLISLNPTSSDNSSHPPIIPVILDSSLPLQRAKAVRSMPPSKPNFVLISLKSANLPSSFPSSPNSPIGLSSLIRYTCVIYLVNHSKNSIQKPQKCMAKWKPSALSIEILAWLYVLFNQYRLFLSSTARVQSITYQRN